MDKVDRYYSVVATIVSAYPFIKIPSEIRYPKVYGWSGTVLDFPLWDSIGAKVSEYPISNWFHNKK